jgi:DNA-binding beta-propeller fold protein YncE
MPIRAAILALVLSLISSSAEAPIRVRLPNGRLLDPLGDWQTLAPFPFSIAVRPGGLQLAIPSIGWPFSLNIVDHPGTPSATVTRIPKSNENDPNVEVYTGIVYSPDGATLYAATGDSGAVDLYSTETWTRTGHIALDEGTFAASLALSPDGRLLYVLDQGRWMVTILDLTHRLPPKSLPTGANPMALALSPDGRRLYVANSGLFEYQLIPGVKENDVLGTGLHFPPFGYPSGEARRGATVEGRKILGLGSENDPRGSSLWTYNVGDPSRALAKLRLGALIDPLGRGVVGGASPSGIVADTDRVYVTLSHSDSVAVVSGDGAKLEREIPLSPFPEYRNLRGIMPFGITQDSSRLFVAETGINAVAVIDKSSGQVLGHLPTGWFPSAAAIAPGDANVLYVVNSKGKGAGPNGESKAYIGELEHGSLSTIDLSAVNFEASTPRVLHANHAAHADSSPLPKLKHVFLIVRENRTFDEIFGDLDGANGDPKLARFGLHGWAAERDNGAILAKDLSVTPNAHALVRRFATSDRFFVDSDVSADGHRWAMNAAPAPWMVLSWTSGYGGRRTSKATSPYPGRRALGGGADAPMPEDEPEFGMLWEHFARSGLGIRNYGENLEIEGAAEIDGTAPEGHRLVLNAPVPKPVFASTDRAYPTFNLGIPDQFRVEEFIKDFGRLVKTGKAPALTVIRLPGDHTAKPRPGDGYPYRASYVADNDLALGRIASWISHSSIWKDSAIFVIEDDAQDGLDHIDAHRSPLLVISPWVRRGALSHRPTSMPSVHKTMYELLGLGNLNLEDALAADLSDMFANTPDLAPFDPVASDPKVFDPSKAHIAKPKTAEEARQLLDRDNAQEIAAAFPD